MSRGFTGLGISTDSTSVSNRRVVSAMAGPAQAGSVGGSSFAVHVGATVVNLGNTTSGTVAYPAGIASGDKGLLTATISSLTALTTPTGWTLEEQHVSGAGHDVYVFSRTMDGSEGASVTVSWAATSKVVCVMDVWRGVKMGARSWTDFSGSTSTAPGVPTVASAAPAVFTTIWTERSSTPDTTITEPYATSPLGSVFGTGGGATSVGAAYANVPDNDGTIGFDVWTRQVSTAANMSTLTVIWTDPSAVTSRTLTPAVATNDGVALGRTKSRTLTPTTTTNDGAAVGRSKSWLLTPGTTTNVGVALGRTKSKSLTTANETDAAVALVKTDRIERSLTPAAETAAAQILGRTKARALAPAAETDAGVALTITDRIQRSLTPASEADAATALTGRKSRIPTSAAETDSAIGPARGKSRTLTPATETDWARPLTRPLQTITVAASTSGTVTGTVATVTLPTYVVGDYIVLAIASNNANAQTFGSNVTATALGSTTNRLNLWKIVPQDGSQTTFTVTIGASSVMTWWIATMHGVDHSLPLAATVTNIGNSTTATIEGQPATAAWVLTGNEKVLSFGTVNSTATWTTTGSTIFNTTSGNAALMVNSNNAAVGALTTIPANMDRGLGGTSRNESAGTLVLQPVGNSATVNRLTNPSFEDAAATSTGWDTEETVAGTPAFTKVSSGAIDGTRVQQMQYAGQAGDSAGTGNFAIYQSPITATPGEELTFRVSLSGSKSNCTMIVGIEGFAPGQVYISEADTTVTTLTGSMVEYSVTYTVPPTANAVAAYVQVNEVVPTTSLTAQLDKAVLALTTPSATIALTLTPAAETDAAGVVVKTDRIQRAITPALETETALQPGRSRYRALTPADETAAVVILGRTKARLPGTTLEADTGVILRRTAGRNVAPAAETDIGVALDFIVGDPNAPAPRIISARLRIRTAHGELNIPEVAGDLRTADARAKLRLPVTDNDQRTPTAVGALR